MVSQTDTPRSRASQARRPASVAEGCWAVWAASAAPWAARTGLRRVPLGRVPSSLVRARRWRALMAKVLESDHQPAPEARSRLLHPRNHSSLQRGLLTARPVACSRPPAPPQLQWLQRQVCAAVLGLSRIHTTALSPSLLSTVISNSQERSGSHTSTLFASPSTGFISVNSFWAKVSVPGFSPGRIELRNEVMSRVLATSDGRSSADQQVGATAPLPPGRRQGTQGRASCFRPAYLEVAPRNCSISNALRRSSVRRAISSRRQVL